MITGLAHAAVTVKDMAESIRFYTEALGFKHAFDFQHPVTGEPWIVYLNISHGQFIELFYGGEEDCPWHDSLTGFNHLCLGTDDIFAAVQKVRDAGYTIDSEPVQGLDHNWQAWTKDPNGIRIELMQIMPDSPQSKY
jgi:catechol 2,3-dioxygenase-like lactoylglutathione lyase family enzyme